MPTLVTAYHVKINNAELKPEYQQFHHSLIVESTLNLPSLAEFKLLDDVHKLLNDPLFEVGNSLEIFVGEGDDHKIFDGEIVEIEPHFEHPHSYCIVRGLDRLHWLMRGQFTRVFKESSDSAIAEDIAASVGLKAQTQKTSASIDYVIQANETRLDFLQRRAAPLGFVIYADGMDMHFKPPGVRKKVEMSWGSGGLSEFRPRLSTLNQPTEIIIRAIDPVTGEVITGRAEAGVGQPVVGEPKDRVKATQTKRQNSIPQGSAPAIRYVTVHGKAETIRNQVENVAKGEANRRSSEYIQAEGVCSGNPDIIAGTELNINNVGKRFEGTYIVSAATHIFSGKKDYKTEFKVAGMHSHTLQHLLGQETLPHNGLTTAIVTEVSNGINTSSARVQYRSLEGNPVSAWARVVSVGAGNNKGIQFLPEHGDEVLIGFEHGDIHAPYVIGGLWNSKIVPPEANETLVEKNFVKRRIIRSRTGHTITLDDSDSSLGITVDDGKGGKIHIDTKNKTMTLEAPEGIEIKSKKITINGSDLVSIDGKAIKIG